MIRSNKGAQVARTGMGRALVGFACVAVLGFVAGCGSSNNDQGLSFTNLGFYAVGSGGACEGNDLPLASINVPISSVEETAASGGGEVRAIVSLQNNLVGQTVRPDRIFFEYRVSGASDQPPGTAVAVSGLLGPGSGDGDTSLPDGLGSIGNCQSFDLPIITSAVMTYINLNRRSFPELPFTIEVRATASGVTSAGNRLETNRQSIFVQFTPDLVIPPSQGNFEPTPQFDGGNDFTEFSVD